MKTFKKELVYFIIVIALGAVFFIVGLNQHNDFTRGMGAAFVAIGILKIIQLFIISRNEERVKKYKLNKNEERIKFIGYKSCSLLFLLTIIGELIAALILTACEMALPAEILCYVAAGQSILYVVVFYIYSRIY